MNAEVRHERTLQEIVREILREAGSLAFEVSPVTLAGSGIGAALSFAPSARAILSRALERELLAVHAAELAWLLREAVRLRIAATEPDAGTARVFASDADALPLAVWKLSLREQLACSAVDGVRIARSAFEVLRRVRACEPGDWPSALELARAALALESCEAGRVKLAEAHLAAGEARQASLVLALELANSRATCISRSVLSRLSDAQASSGALARACELRSLEAHAAELAA